MQYMGGKTRIAKQIAAEIDKVRKPGQLVWDAFCGGLSVSVALSKNGPVLASDGCGPLVELYAAVKGGWDPPSSVDKATWTASKHLPDTDPMKAFCGFGCSFAGKWFGGFAEAKPIVEKGVARTKVNNYAFNSRRLLLSKLEIVANIQHLDFLQVEPGSINAIIYCDIPYENTTSYPGGPKFDRSKFIDLAQEHSKFTDVFVSEYNFPIGKEVWSQALDSRVDVKSGSAKKSVERLYHIARKH
jgi:DNA adenine methylase